MVTNFASVVASRLSERSSKGLANAVSHAIGEGELAEGAVLPPIRRVADELALSPSTVGAAWKLLSRAGAIRSEGRRGTVVLARRGPGPVRYRRAIGRSLALGVDLSTGVPDGELLPDLGPAFVNLHRAWTSNSYLDDPIIPGLVDALRADWPYDSEDFAIVDGAMDAVDHVAALTLRFGDLVVVENPSFPPLLDLLEGLGVRVLGVDLDDEGLVTDALTVALDRGPKALFLQPRAHNPTGVSMSEARAMAIASRLSDRDVVIVEDDSAGAIASSAPVSLGTWLAEKTVHIRSFSKSHGPDLRLAALSGPSELMGRLRERRLLGQGWTSRLLQAVLLDLLERPESREEVARARVTYARRRAAVVNALTELGVRVTGGDGLNIWLPVCDETTALLYLASHGIGAAAGSPFVTRQPTQPHLRITVGLVREGAGALAERLRVAATLGPSVGPR